MRVPVLSSIFNSLRGSEAPSTSILNTNGPLLLYPSKAGASATAAAALVGATAALSGVGTASPPSSGGGGVAACTEKTSTLAETVAGRATAAASAVAAGKKSSSDAATGKPGSTYADRFFRVIGLMDPRHILTTEADVRRYQKLLKEYRVGEVSGKKKEDKKIQAP